MARNPVWCQKNAQYATIVKEMEGELELLREERQSNVVSPPLLVGRGNTTGLSAAQGDASDAARRVKAELEIKCRELQEQVSAASNIVHHNSVPHDRARSALTRVR